MGIFDKLLGKGRKKGKTDEELHDFTSQQTKSREESYSETKTNFEEMQKNRHECLTILVKKGIWEMEFADMLEEQCKNSEKYILIMLQCETPEQITKGFCKIAKELQRKNDPLAEAAEMGCSAQFTDGEYYIKIRDNFIMENRNFCEAFKKTIFKELHEKLGIGPGDAEG